MDPTQMPPQDPSQAMPPMPPAAPSMPPQGGAPMMPDPNAGSQPITPEQKQQLLDLIQKIREKLGAFHAQHFAGNNKSDRARRELLRQVFEVMQKAGVDLTNRESVAAFIDKLRQQNPQLADQFEESISFLMGDSNFTPPTDPNASMNLGVNTPALPNVPPSPPSLPNNENVNPNEIVPQG